MTAATVQASRPEGPRGRLISIDVPAAFAARHQIPGQYCAVEHAGETGWFAIASAPGVRPFEFYVQPGGGSSEQLLRLTPGATVTVGAPQGAGFAVDRVLADDGPVFILATGSGLSGVRSTIQRLAQAERAALLYVGARTAADLLFVDEYPTWRGITVRPVLSRAGDARRYVQQAFADEQSDLSRAWVIACGQAEMQAEARDIATAAGLPPDRFLTNH